MYNLQHNIRIIIPVPVSPGQEKGDRICARADSHVSENVCLSKLSINADKSAYTIRPQRKTFLIHNLHEQRPIQILRPFVILTFDIENMGHLRCHHRTAPRLKENSNNSKLISFQS
jgi:hypothetical protein